WNGVDVTALARRNRLSLQGGISTGKTTTDNCDVVVHVDNPSDRFCHVETPFLTQGKVAASYQLPWELLASVAFQSIPGVALSATYVSTNALISPSLGRNLAAGAAGTVTVNLLEPGTRYTPRLNQLDLRTARTFQIGSRARVQAMVDIFNATNASTVLAQNSTYGTNGATWLVPQSILQGRLVKFGVNVSF